MFIKGEARDWHIPPRKKNFLCAVNCVSKPSSHCVEKQIIIKE
jgi:hypothetical protein